MDYVIGSVAALISGNVTPNRPKIVRRALTPTKHQPSPNVTPKSEFVEDRSIFISPTQQKKKAIVKKSPKRIFQNPDLDASDDCEGNSSLTSPNTEKVKKHLEEELDAGDMGKSKFSMSKSPSNKLNKSSDKVSLKKYSVIENSLVADDSTPKKKKRGNSETNVTQSYSIETNSVNTTLDPADLSNIIDTDVKALKKKQRKSVTEVQTENTVAANNLSSDKQEITSNKNETSEEVTTTLAANPENKKSKKRKKKNKNNQNVDTKTPIEKQENVESTTEVQNEKKKKKKKNHKNKTSQVQKDDSFTDTKSQTDEMEVDKNSESDSEEVKSRNIPNPNAITEKDSDSEHDSDNEIESENEQENEKVLTNENEPEPSSDEEEKAPKESSTRKKEQNNQQNKEAVMTVDEINRTLFVGNVPFSSKCKKEIKKIFNKYGQINTIRIRTIPVKDARVTPKLAIIKNELHPERTTVNVYVKFSDPTSVRKALVENNTVLNGNHLRVSASENTGAEHDPRCAVFVGNLPFALEDDTLRATFHKCGEIDSVRIIRDKKSNAGKGFGYVNFASKDGVELALALSEEDLTIKNRILRVKRCTPQKPGGKPGGGGKWGNQRDGDRNRGNQGQVINLGNQGQAKNWNNQRQGGRNFGNQGHGEYSGGQRQGGQGQGGGKWGNQGQGREEGAARRLMHKRKFQEGVNNEVPPNKIQKNVNQPNKEKKPKKEFVGVTAEKKKKQKFNKGQKKKKALSEILTKKS